MREELGSKYNLLIENMMTNMVCKVLNTFEKNEKRLE